MPELKTGRGRDGVREIIDQVGFFLVEGFHLLALFAIGAATVWSAAVAFLGMWARGHATVDDILLLFIYLELGAMVGIYFQTQRMPVRFLIYVAITALTRLMIADINVNHKPGWGIIYVSAAILLLAIAELIVRYGKCRYPMTTAAPEITDPTPKTEKP